MEKWWQNGEKWGGGMGGNGELWEIAKNTFWEKHTKMCESGGKGEENWGKMRQFGRLPFFPVPLSSLQPRRLSLKFL